MISWCDLWSFGVGDSVQLANFSVSVWSFGVIKGQCVLSWCGRGQCVLKWCDLGSVCSVGVVEVSVCSVGVMWGKSVVSWCGVESVYAQLM